MYQVEDAPTPLAATVANGLKESIVGVMIGLSNEPNLQVQIGEAITIIAQADFPQDWQGLVDVSTRYSFSSTTDLMFV